MTETDWDKDGELLEKGQLQAMRSSCQSVVVADSNGKRGPILCVVKDNHTIHESYHGDTWWLDSSGHWKHDGPELTNMNMKGASGPVIDRG